MTDNAPDRGESATPPWWQEGDVVAAAVPVPIETADRWERTRKAAREGKTMRLGPCKRCDRSPDDHRLDDSLNVSPVDPKAKFRCVVEGCDCPDYTTKNGSSTS